MRVLVASLLVLQLVGLPAVSGASTLTYDYEAPGLLSTPLVRTNVALCDDPDEPCVGGAVFPIRDRNVVSSASDDLSGSQAPMLLCVWAPGGTQSCTGEDAVTQAGCGARVLLNIPFIPDQGVVYLYALHLEDDLDFCIATRGTLEIYTF